MSNCRLDREEYRGVCCQLDRIREATLSMTGLDCFATTDAREVILNALELAELILAQAEERTKT